MPIVQMLWDKLHVESLLFMVRGVLIPVPKIEHKQTPSTAPRSLSLQGWHYTSNNDIMPNKEALNE